MIALIYFWATRLPNHLAVQYLSVSTATVVQWYTYLRDICSWYLLNAPPVVLGGPGQVVQVDETLLTRTKYNRGRRRRSARQWLFGVYDCTTRTGYLKLVPDRSAPTLQALIRRVVAPGTEIWSDEWRSYLGLGTMGYVHRTMNHLRHFIDQCRGSVLVSCEAPI